jgi:sugar lactone lactonase YvrE
VNHSILVAPTALLLAAVSVFAQQAPPEIPFDSVANFLKLPPDIHLGEVAGVAVNSKRHVFVFTRANSTGPAYAAAAAQLLEFDKDGKFIREIGHNLYAWSFAHAVSVDKDDNVWVVDKGSDMIIRFNPEGRVTMVVGRKKEAADENAEAWKHPNPPLPHIDGQFRQPTGVAWDSKGNTFISDGYINARVAKLDKNGDWVKSWGEHGNKPGEFNTPHSVAVDANDNVYVADRGNSRIQVFDTDGRYLREFRVGVPVEPGMRPAIGNPPAPDAPFGAMSNGAPDALCITPGPNQVMYIADLYPGRIYKLTLDGRVLGVMGKSGKQLGEFGWVHQLACPSENELYVAELLNWRVQKLLLQPSKAAGAR